MKYRITAVKHQKKDGAVKHRRAYLPVSRLSIERARAAVERIRLDTLFEIGELIEPPPRHHTKRRWHKAHRTVLWLKKLRGSKKYSRASHGTYLYLGALASSVCIFILTATVCVLSLFSPFLSSYQTLVAPSVVGMSIDEAQSLTDPRFDIAISYQSSGEQKAGIILSQFPTAGTQRKLYKNKVCVLSLTVSSGKGFKIVDELGGKEQREAMLLLRNKGMAVSVAYEYSSSVAAGSVISTAPAAGERLFDGDELLLTVSRGKRVTTVSVPDLYLLNEAKAVSALESKGLALGSVSYETSDVPAGKIISQSVSAYTRLSRGATVDITVSLGRAYVQRTVPDLFGLTAEQAEQELSKYGLVLGSILTVSSAAPTETVVSQYPMAGTPITSQITSVDVYISTN